MRRIISVVALLTLTLFAAPAMAAGPVAGVANVTTYATFPTCENPIGTLRIVKKSNTAQYTGRVTINGSTYFSFTLTKAGNTVYAFSQEINAPVTV